MTIRISEIFYSIEGEGPYTGRPTIFVRFFGCNFTCAGFSNETATSLNFYPVVESRDELKKQEFKIGCDSAYSWHPHFKNLAKDYADENEVAAEILLLLGASTHKPILCFTGGEPMLYQKYIGRIWDKVCNRVSSVLIETNGSLKPKAEFWQGFEQDNSDRLGLANIIWSISPKLSNSGEPWDKAINPEAIATMYGETYLKFVSDGSAESLAEIEKALREYAMGSGMAYKIFRNQTWLMPEGSTFEQQTAIQRKVADLCIKEGFNFSARVHVWVYNNEIGT